jgi:hypothetical protein
MGQMRHGVAFASQLTHRDCLAPGNSNVSLALTHRHCQIGFNPTLKAAMRQRCFDPQQELSGGVGEVDCFICCASGLYVVLIDLLGNVLKFHDACLRVW